MDLDPAEVQQQLLLFQQFAGLPKDVTQPITQTQDQTSFFRSEETQASGQQQQYVQDPETKHLREEILGSVRLPRDIPINGERFRQKFRVEGATNCAEALAKY